MDADNVNATAAETAEFEEPPDPRLMSGESVVFKTEKHWMAPVTDSVMAILLILGALVLVWLQGTQTDGIMGFVNRVLSLAAIGLFLGGLGWIVYNIVAWRSASFVVTNHRILAEQGLLRKRSTDTLLESVSDVRSRQSAIGKSLGFGDVQILSASGEAGADKFTSVVKADELKRNILEQKLSGGAAPWALGQLRPPPLPLQPRPLHPLPPPLAWPIPWRHSIGWGRSATPARSRPRSSRQRRRSSSAASEAAAPKPTSGGRRDPRHRLTDCPDCLLGERGVGCLDHDQGPVLHEEVVRPVDDEPAYLLPGDLDDLGVVRRRRVQERVQKVLFAYIADVQREDVELQVAGGVFSKSRRQVGGRLAQSVE